VSEMYSYDFDIHNVYGSDSAFQQGEKNVIATVGEEEDNIVDYIPLSLYPGRFKYTLNVAARGVLVQAGGVIDIPPVEEWLMGSDVVIGRLGFGNFVFHGLGFLPAMPADFGEHEHLFSYVELYGLVPDSLDYHAAYRVCDDKGGIVLEQTKSVLKHDYMQVDTHSLVLSPLVEGAYEYVLTVLDPSSQSSVTRKSWFSVRVSDDISGQEFYEEIKYLVSEDEYRRYQRLNETQRKIFLKEFWSRHDYFQLEKRMIEADAKFSAGVLLGRDSERGRLYIRIGPPDEIEIMSVENWARPFEVWHYYGKNDFIFSDIKNDHNPKLIKVLKPGEMTKLMATGFRDGTREEEWLSDIAPGTYNWQEDVEGVVE
jgi:GWxTD domain-containing protein